MIIYDFKKAVEEKEQRERELCEFLGLNYPKDIERELAKSKQLDKKLSFIEIILVTLCSIATCVFLFSLLFVVNHHVVSQVILTSSGIIMFVSAITVTIVIISRGILLHRTYKKISYLK